MFVPVGFVSCHLNLNCEERKTEEEKQCSSDSFGNRGGDKHIDVKMWCLGKNQDHFFIKQAEYLHFRTENYLDLCLFARMFCYLKTFLSIFFSRESFTAAKTHFQQNWDIHTSLYIWCYQQIFYKYLQTPGNATTLLL